jgi:hypothetical protein
MAADFSKVAGEWPLTFLKSLEQRLFMAICLRLKKKR